MAIEVNVYTISQPAELAEDWRLYKVGPVGEGGRLSHQFLLPQYWRATVLDEKDLETMGPDHFTSIAAFRPPEDTSALFEVAVTKWPVEVGLEEFFKLVAEQADFKPLNLRRIVLKGVRVMDGEFSGVMNQIPIKARVMVFKNHGLLFRIWGICSEAAYKTSLERIFHIAVESFALQTTGESRYLEELATFKSDGPEGVTFQYPPSWERMELSGQTRGLWVTDFRLFNADHSDIAAYHRFQHWDRSVFPDENPYSLKSKVVEAWHEAGLIQEQELKQADLESEGETPFSGKQFLMRGRLNQMDVILRIAILRTRASYCALATMSPEKQGGRLVWMAAKRIHELALRTIRLSNR